MILNVVGALLGASLVLSPFVVWVWWNFFHKMPKEAKR